MSAESKTDEPPRTLAQETRRVMGVSHTYRMAFAPFEVTVGVESRDECARLVRDLRAGGDLARKMADYIEKARDDVLREETDG